MARIEINRIETINNVFFIFGLTRNLDFCQATFFAKISKKRESKKMRQN